MPDQPLVKRPMVPFPEIDRGLALGIIHGLQVTVEEAARSSVVSRGLAIAMPRLSRAIRLA